MRASISNPATNARRRSMPDAPAISAAASAAGSSGTVGWPLIAQLTSSKSSACAAAPFTSAASAAGTRSPVPQSVAPSRPPCARAQSRTRRATGSSRPAIAQARPSRIATRAAAAVAGGIASARSLSTNPAARVVSLNGVAPSYPSETLDLFRGGFRLLLQDQVPAALDLHHLSVLHVLGPDLRVGGRDEAVLRAPE